MKPFSIIVACTEQTFGIGCKGKLPWKLNGDMIFFKFITTNTHSPGKSNAVIMGRKTYQSIPSKFRPLPSRVNIVLSSNSCIREELGLPTDVLVASSLKNALDMLETEKYQNYIENVFVIGGASVYSEAICMPNCVSIYLTQIKKEFLGMDTFFPTIPREKFQIVSQSQLFTENDIVYQFIFLNNNIKNI